MFGSIRSISFTAQVMIPILGLILFAISWFFPGNLDSDTVYGNGYFYQPDEGWMYPLWLTMARLPLWARIAPALLITLLTAWLLVRTDMKNLLMGARSYAIAFVFLFLTISGGHYFLFHPAIPAAFFMVLSYRFLLDLYKDEHAFPLVFAMGFSWGVAILLYPPLSLLIPALMTGLLLMVSTGWRHWLVSLLGLIVPALLMGIFWYLMGHLDYEVTTFLTWFDFRPTLIPGFIGKDPILAAWFGIIFFWVIVASVKYRNPKIQSRQLFQTNFLVFLSILIMMFFLESISVEILFILVIPVTYLMTFWALRVEKGWKRDLFFFTLLISFAFFRFRGLL